MKSLFLALALAFAGIALADVPNTPPPNELPKAAEPLPVDAPKHPEGIEKAGAGVISGGWEYVYAAYGLAVLGIAGYGLSLFVRKPKERPS